MKASLDTTAMLASLISGRPLSREALGDVDVESFWDEAQRHGVVPLAANALMRRDDMPTRLTEPASAVVAGEVAADLLHEARLRELLEALSVAGVTALLIKGVLLAYTHYHRPDLRPRVDVDLLIHPNQRDAAEAVLASLGFEGDIQASAGLVLHQRSYTKSTHGQTFIVDLHWRLANPAVFGHVLSFDEMNATAVKVPHLSVCARGLSPVHSLLVACVHRVAHHFADDRLIWLFDIHLIASRLTAVEWSAFAELAAERRVIKVCSAGLDQSVLLFGTNVPEALWRRLPDGVAEAEITATYLRSDRLRVFVVLDDLRALRTWNDRWRLLRDYAFPPVNYMRDVYAPSSELPLAWLYMRRMLFGAWKRAGLSARHS